MKALLILLVLCVCAEAKAKQKPKHSMALKDSLAAHWGFEHDQALFPGVFDQSGNGNDLIPNSNFVAGSNLVPGKVGNAIKMDGSHLFNLNPSSAGISHQGNGFTVAFWYRPSSLLFFEQLVSGGEWSVAFDSGVFKVTVDGKEMVLPNTIETEQWYFIALGWMDTPRPYIWAVVNMTDQVRTVRDAITTTISSFTVGNGNGTIDDFAIWRRSVPAHELYQIWNKANGLPFEEWGDPENCRSIECCD